MCAQPSECLCPSVASLRHLCSLFLLPSFLILVLMSDHVHAFHYNKYHISDSCTTHSRAPYEVRLTPQTNTTAVMIKLRREFYKPSMNCTVILRAPPGYGLTLFFTKFKLRRHNKKADRLEIMHHTTMLARFYGHNQDELPKKNVIARPLQNVLHINFYSESFMFPTSLAGKGFKLIVNLNSVTKTNGECNATTGLTINCRNGMCIDPLLECDSVDNCLNNFDEIECDETSETKLSLYVFLCTILVMVILVVMFMMKNKDKRKEIVRRMSRVYANNPILCVMETSTGVVGPGAGSNSSSTTTPSSGASPVAPPSLKRTNNVKDIESKLPPTLAYLEDNRQTHKLKTSKSKISLSLPQGIDQLSC